MPEGCWHYYIFNKSQHSTEILYGFTSMIIIHLWFVHLISAAARSLIVMAIIFVLVIIAVIILVVVTSAVVVVCRRCRINRCEVDLRSWCSPFRLISILPNFHYG